MSEPLAAQAREVGELFPELFLRLHRRRAKRAGPTPQSWAVLNHLAMAGPLTVTEAAQHMERAQSVMSEIVDGLERKGLLARMRDERDRRRTLVWLTDVGHRALEEERQVLSLELLERALGRMKSSDRQQLVCGLRALVRAAEAAPRRKEKRE